MKILNILSALFMPTTKQETIFFSVDIWSVLVFVFAGVSSVDFWIKEYILILTAVSITITTGVKLYNLLTSNKKNKDIG